MFPSFLAWSPSLRPSFLVSRLVCTLNLQPTLRVVGFLRSLFLIFPRSLGCKDSQGPLGDPPGGSPQGIPLGGPPERSPGDPPEGPPGGSIRETPGDPPGDPREITPGDPGRILEGPPGENSGGPWGDPPGGSLDPLGGPLGSSCRRPILGL